VGQALFTRNVFLPLACRVKSAHWSPLGSRVPPYFLARFDFQPLKNFSQSV
jgi:hypothetical protein